MNDLNSFMATCERYRQAQVKLNKHNKNAIFAALAAANLQER